MTERLLASAQVTGCDAFVFVSSPSIYADFKDQEGLTEDSPPTLRPLNAYARTKLVAERQVLAADRPGFRTISIRPRALIGPDDAVLLPRILEMVRRGRLPVLRGGVARIDLTDVRDAAKALVLTDQNREAVGGRPINISGGQPIRILELAERLCEVLQVRPRLIPVPMAPMRVLASVSETVCGAWPGRPEPKITPYLSLIHI